MLGNGGTTTFPPPIFMRMRQKFFLILIAMITAYLPARAYDFMVDGLCYNINDDGNSVTLTWETSPGSEYNGFDIITYNEINADVVIPEQVTYNGVTYTVIAIDSYCFNICEGIESVTIPETVKSIGSFAFKGCVKLKSLAIPKSIEHIGTNPILSCPDIDKITVNAENPFFDSRNGCNAVIATSSNMLISGCKKTIIPNGVSIISESAFEGCGELPRFNLPQSISKICDFAFAGCEISNCVLRIPNSVTYIGNDALPFLVDVYTIIIGESTQYIGKRAFANESTTDATIQVVCLAENPPYLDYIPYKPTSHPFWWLGGGEYDNKMILYVPDIDVYTEYSNDMYHDWFWLVWDDVLPLSEFDGNLFQTFCDVNCDGNVTSSDVTALYNYLLNSDNTYAATGDVNGDGVITAADITAVYNILLGN